MFVRYSDEAETIQHGEAETLDQIASEDDPQYEIKSDKTDHIAAHKCSALERGW